MGSWFSNIHIRKNATATEETIEKYVDRIMASKHYLPCASINEADGIIAIAASEDCSWISVYSDMLSLEEPGKCAGMLTQLSSELQTDALGISCFDSDYLYLNLINTADQTDAWVGIGSASGLGIKRRTGIAAWKKKVSDFGKFSESAKKKYVFAEEFLAVVEGCLELPMVRSFASYECLKDFELDKIAKYFYFKLSDEMKSRELPVLVQRTSSLDPCFLDKPSSINSLNIGGKSKGLSVFFIGPYVEYDEITFSEVAFVRRRNNRPERTSIELQKVQLTDGQWAYYYHDPDFEIPQKVDERLPARKRIEAEFERSFVVRFVPHGNPRKILDITVVLVPDKNPAGQTGWNVWHSSGSKAAYIERYNRNWGMHTPVKTQMLRIEDFD